MGKKKTLLLTLFLIVCMTMIILYQEKDNIRFKREYEYLNNKKNYIKVNINADNPMVYVNIKDITNLIEEGTGVIYFGFPDCSECRNLVPVLLEVAEENNVDKIYYYNVYHERDVLKLDNNDVVVKKKKTKNYEVLSELLKEKFDDYILKNGEADTGEKRIDFPIVAFVKQGEIKFFYASAVKNKKNFDILTKEEKKELKKNFKKGFGSLNDSCKIDRC